MTVPNLLLIPPAATHYQLKWHLTWHSMNRTNMSITRDKRPPQIDFCMCNFSNLGRIGMSSFKNGCTESEASGLFSELRTSELERRKARWRKKF